MTNKTVFKMCAVALQLALTTIFLNILSCHGDFIVGGELVDIKPVPYHAELYMANGVMRCGATIVTKKHVVSAAHCVGPMAVKHHYESKMQIHAGSVSINYGGSWFNVKQTHIHPQFNNITIDYDVMVVEIDGTFDESLDQVPIKSLATDPNTDHFVGMLMTATGMGYTSEGGDRSPELRMVKLPVVTMEECRRVYLDVTDRMFCAGYPQGNQDACDGDSGGPLVMDGEVLMGIISFGSGCGRAHTPGAYTNVAAVREWIENIIFN